MQKDKWAHVFFAIFLLSHLFPLLTLRWNCRHETRAGPVASSGAVAGALSPSSCLLGALANPEGLHRFASNTVQERLFSFSIYLNQIFPLFIRLNMPCSHILFTRNSHAHFFVPISEHILKKLVLFPVKKKKSVITSTLNNLRFHLFVSEKIWKV